MFNSTKLQQRVNSLVTEIEARMKNVHLDAHVEADELYEVVLVYEQLTTALLKLYALKDLALKHG